MHDWRQGSGNALTVISHSDNPMSIHFSSKDDRITRVVFYSRLGCLITHYMNWEDYHPFNHLYSYTLSHKSEIQYHLYRVRNNKCKFSGWVVSTGEMVYGKPH
jgi:hypothetical protein